jgi:hypothetical protein
MQTPIRLGIKARLEENPQDTNRLILRSTPKTAVAKFPTKPMNVTEMKNENSALKETNTDKLSAYK